MPFDSSPSENSTLTDVQKVLLGAAQLIRERGHCKYVFEDVHGSLCARGAIAAAECKTHWELPWPPAGAALHFARTLTWHEVDGVPDIGDWNNAPERTAAEVVAALEQAAFAKVE